MVPASAFPTNDFKSINYWVDVVFTETNGGIAPVVTTQPAAQSLCSGTNVVFTSQANGNPAPTVQWQSSMMEPIGQILPALPVLL